MIISLYKLLTHSFFDPSQLGKATELKRKKSIFLFLLISLLASIPFYIGNMKSMDNMVEDISRVTRRIPSFTIHNGKMELEEPLEQAVVVRTDSMNLIFDIHNQYDDYQKEKDVENTILNLLFKEDSFTILASQVPINVLYKNAEGVTDEFFQTLLHQFSRNRITMIVIVVLSFLFGIVETAIQLLLFTLIANLVSALFRIRLPFSVNWKMMMVASFVPTLFFSILNSLLIYPYGQKGMIATISAYLYYKGIKGFVNKIPK